MVVPSNHFLIHEVTRACLGHVTSLDSRNTDFTEIWFKIHFSFNTCSIYLNRNKNNSLLQNNNTNNITEIEPIHPRKLATVRKYWWLNEILQRLHSISNGDTVVLYYNKPLNSIITRTPHGDLLLWATADIFQMLNIPLKHIFWTNKHWNMNNNINIYEHKSLTHWGKGADFTF